MSADIDAIALRPLAASPETIDALAALLVETVAAGGSVSFMHPLPREEAATFWRGSLEAAARGGRVVLGAYAGEALIGTVTLLVDLPPNQPHRAEIAKMMTLPAYRGRGVARALLREAERIAALRGRTLIVLDTAADEGASGFYEKLGYVRVGEIPDFALKPHGGLTGTLIYFKRLAPAAA
ncbi:GCN5-related N-acetyltransferase [Ancylobacter novellus DSM 506]|uniref:GCN5-related N-acetyltransferase n=1 Tax=Ancylobacter novellus (strain ATCC 8093 / DSM 506 / JCM 20403 / CCM 1077 / IAM 12100 / NBRC 12443 / NCIMB 10456) TaxID=639283 RepID=D7A4C6_ANCN5|nr:GCN5-related N-acetyltransferase [Ancylobacter novellus DSM 506]